MTRTNVVPVSAEDIEDALLAYSPRLRNLPGFPFG